MSEHALGSNDDVMDDMAAEYVTSQLDSTLRLTRRRVAIIRLLRRGWTEKRIVRELGIARDTVAEHIAITMRALHAHTHAQLVAEAISHGFVELRLYDSEPE